MIGWYNKERLHRAGYLRPVDYYRGDPAARTKCGAGSWPPASSPARSEPTLRQPTLPLYA